MTTIRLTLLTTHHSYWCDTHAEGKDLFIWDVAHFSEETTKRDIVVNRDIPAAVNIGVLALLRAKQRFQFVKKTWHCGRLQPIIGTLDTRNLLARRNRQSCHRQVEH